MFVVFTVLFTTNQSYAASINLVGGNTYYLKITDSGSPKSYRITGTGTLGGDIGVHTVYNPGSVRTSLSISSNLSTKGNEKFVSIKLPSTYNITSLILYDALTQKGNELAYTLLSGNPFSRVPQMITTIVATPLSDTSVRLSWSEPSSLTNFNFVEIIRTDNNERFEVPRGTNELILTGLEPDTTYNFKLASGNRLDGVYSVQQSTFVTTLFDPLEVPPEEINNLQSFVYSDRIKFTWDNPSDVLHHEVRIYRDGQQIATAVTPASQFTDYDLTEHTTYTFVFYTVTTDSRRSEGISVTETTKGKPRGKVQGLWAEPRNGEIEVSFYDHPEAIEGYAIYLDGVRAVIQDTFATLTGLENGHEYTIQVAAVNEWGESERSDPVKVTPEEPIIPDRPQVRVSATHESITLEWDQVAHAVAYRIYEENEEGQFIVAETTDLYFTAYGLDPGESKTYFVSAFNDLGESEKYKVTAKTTKTIHFSGYGFANVLDVIKTGFSFLNKFGIYIAVVLGIMFAPTILSFLFWLFSFISPSKKKEEPVKKKRVTLSPEDRQRRARERRAKERANNKKLKDNYVIAYRGELEAYNRRQRSSRDIKVWADQPRRRKQRAVASGVRQQRQRRVVRSGR